MIHTHAGGGGGGKEGDSGRQNVIPSDNAIILIRGDTPSLCDTDNTSARESGSGGKEIFPDDDDENVVKLLCGAIGGQSDCGAPRARHVQLCAGPRPWD